MNPVMQQEIALADVVSGPVRVEVALAGVSEERALDDLASVLRSIFTMADCGAYVTHAASPKDAAFEVVDEQVGDFAITWECRARAVDWRFAQIVRNELVMFSQCEHPISRFSIVSPEASALRRVLPPLGGEPLDAWYPGVSAAVRIPIVKSTPHTFRGGRRVAIEFVDPLTDPALKATIDLLETWAAASFGAYGSTETELWNGESAISDVTPDVMDDWTVEAAIERFGAPEIAWASLINLAARFDTDIARVAKVVIE
jgi:hypothetical protein